MTKNMPDKVSVTEEVLAMGGKGGYDVKPEDLGWGLHGGRHHTGDHVGEEETSKQFIKKTKHLSGIDGLGSVDIKSAIVKNNQYSLGGVKGKQYALGGVDKIAKAELKTVGIIRATKKPRLGEYK